MLLIVLVVSSGLAATGQTADSGSGNSSVAPKVRASAVSTAPLGVKSLPRNLFQDQKSFWSTPFHMTKQQWQWTVPLTFAGAVMLASDTAIEKYVPTNPSTVSHAVTASNVGLAALAAGGAGMFVWSEFDHSEDKRETALLSAEAATNAALETYVFQYALGRERPFTGEGRGLFFKGGTSFPSAHASVSWAIASVIAHEYPGPLTQILVYGVAGSVSAARVIGQKHFATDVLVGSALGWYAGQQVFRAHSRYSSADIAKWGTFTKGELESTSRQPQNMGSSYVSLDSWVYPAFDRLTAFGYLNDQTGSIRPWSRLECARILADVHRLAGEQGPFNMEASSIVRDLDIEFAYETKLRGGETPNINIELESVYSRYIDVSGRPLRDSFHFAQSISDDFGRPYGRGSNNITGFSSYAAAGPFLMYVRGEYQYGSSIQEYTTSQTQDIAAFDELPANSVSTFGQTSRLRTIEAYAGLNISNWQLTFGQQSLWWGTNRTTSILFSNNAEAMPMLRLERVSPLRLPSVLGLLGPVSVSGFLARMGGVRYLRLGPDFLLYGNGVQQVNPQPYVWGANIAFKPTPNLELGFSITTEFAGHGLPLTLHTFLHTFSQHGNLQPVEPGGRRPMMSASYRPPGLRNRMLLYADWLAEAQPLALLYPDQSGLSAGMYVPRLPFIKKMDLRCEGIYTNIPGYSANNLFYTNFHYPVGYRNYGQIMGSWVGRGGSGGEASTTYWFSARNQATVSYRRMISNASLLQGGNVNDFSGSLSWMLWSHFELAASLQYERWNFRELSPVPNTNIATTIEIRIWPKVHLAAASTSAAHNTKP